MKNSLFYLSIVLCGALLLQVHCALDQRTVKQFQTGPFTFSPVAGIYNLTGLGFDSIPSGLSILAFGDFNSDKYTDVVTVTTDGKTLCLFLWDHNNYTFDNTQNITFGKEIISVIPVDLNYDGLVDLLVLTKSANAGKFAYNAFVATKSNTPFTAQPSLNFEYNEQQPTVAYLDDTFKPSFIIMNNDGVRSVFKFQTDAQNVLTKTETPFSDFVSTAAGCLAVPQGSTIQNPNFNAFVDLNGDCRSDLFIMTTNAGQNYFEIWMRESTGPTFCLVENSPVKSNVASLGFADINGDSGVDLVYIQQDAAATVHIIFNQLKNSAGNACNGTIVSTANLPFINTTEAARKDIYDATASNDATLVYTLASQGFAQDAKLYSVDANNRPHQLRFGDINMDGNPDLLITTITNDQVTKTTVLYNSLVANSKSLRELTTTKPDDMDTDVNSAIGDSNSIYATFFDFDEIGTQSLFYIKSANGQTWIEGYYNNLNQASFFLKALGLDGAQANSSDFFAGMYYGSTFECEVTDINGTNILRKGIQLTKGGYTPLQLPYAFLGLGKTNNYIENFVYGYPISNTNTHKWSPIIPNSQLIITPTGTDANGWKIDVFVKPTSNTLIVVITTAAILLILGMVICYLHYKEKEEDKQHQEKYLHLLG